MGSHYGNEQDQLRLGLQGLSTDSLRTHDVSLSMADFTGQMIITAPIYRVRNPSVKDDANTFWYI